MSGTAVAAETPLSVRHVSRRFGGIVAVDDVTLDLLPGERRAILGPNGAGKTTLFNVIGGQDRPNSGKLHLFGRDITNMSVHGRAALGLSRTFQITNVFSNLTVEENVLLSVHALQKTKMVMYRPLRSYAGLNARARQLMQEWGLWTSATLPRAISRMATNGCSRL